MGAAIAPYRVNLSGGLAGELEKSVSCSLLFAVSPDNKQVSNDIGKVLAPFSPLLRCVQMAC